MTQLSIARQRNTLGLAFACLLALGTVSGLLGVAWPSMRHTFGLPLDALATLLISTTTGVTIGSMLSGQIMARVGMARTLLAANLLAALAMIANATVPAWWMFVAVGLFAGFASGTIGSGLSIYIAAQGTTRDMNWMHAMFGVGATLGPLLMTATIGAGLSWRWGYAAVAVVFVILALLINSAADSISFRSTDVTPQAGNEPFHPTPLPAVLRLPVVLVSLLLFLLYTGVESTTGQWTFTLFTESRSAPTYLAGLMTSLFWAMLTAGRIVFGAASDRIGISRLLRWSMAGGVVSAALFLVNNQWVGFMAVPLMGLSFSIIFPTLLSDTPRRVGRQHAATVIGLQAAAGSVGSAVVPGLAGVLAARLGLEVLGPFLLATAFLLLVINELTMWLSDRNRPPKEEDASSPTPAH